MGSIQKPTAQPAIVENQDTVGILKDRLELRECEVGARLSGPRGCLGEISRRGVSLVEGMRRD